MDGKRRKKTLTYYTASMVGDTDRGRRASNVRAGVLGEARVKEEPSNEVLLSLLVKPNTIMSSDRGPVTALSPPANLVYFPKKWVPSEHSMLSSFLILEFP